MSDLVERLWHSDAASALTNEAARRIEAIENALAAFGEFLEPMRFDRKSDDERAIQLDRLYRSLLSKD